MLTVKQAAQTLGVHENTVRRLSKRGRLRAYRNYLGWRLFDPQDVARLRHQLQRLQREPVIATTEGPDAVSTNIPRGCRWGRM